MRVGRSFALAMTAALAVMCGATPALARPELLLRYQNDPMRKAGVDGCGTCHVKPDGGGARNDFGTAFDAAAREITPLLRATFPSHFTFTSATLPDGSTFHFSDPKSQVAIVQRGAEKIVADLTAIAAPKAAPIPPPANRLSFFVTSTGVPRGGHLGGLAGADRLCQTLAEAAKAGDRTWRAYLSTSFKGAPAVNAGDRIGTGPWYNASGQLLARGPIDLHRKPALDPALVLTETGAAVPAGAVVFTGTLADGTAAVDRTCGNWTGTTGDAAAGAPGPGWNAARTAACTADAAASGAAPRLYCFALR